MRFPNAYSGVKKIFTAEILALISSICMIVAVVMAVFAAANAMSYDAENTDLALIGAMSTGSAMMICFLAAAVLALIAFIINIVGLAKASKDEDAFKMSLFAVIICVALTAAGAVFTTSGFVTSLLSAITTLFELLTTIFVIHGIRNLAIKLNNHEVDRKGAVVFKLIGVVIILEFAARLIGAIFGGPVAGVTAGVIIIVAGILSVIKYFLYLGFLSKAKKMLAA